MQTVGGAPVTPAPKATPVELRIGFLEALDKLNPFQGLNDPSFEFYGMVYDYLYSFDQDGNFVPSIAVNAVPDATSQNWTYWIRQDVNWSDGTPLTAADVAFTINYNAQNFNLLWNCEPHRVVRSAKHPAFVCGSAPGCEMPSPGHVPLERDGLLRPAFCAGEGAL